VRSGGAAEAPHSRGDVEHRGGQGRGLRAVPLPRKQRGLMGGGLGKDSCRRMRTEEARGRIPETGAPPEGMLGRGGPMEGV
jgi:hypothetical protein